MPETPSPNPWEPSEAEHKSVALHHLGWEAGTGAAVWARAVEDVLALHEAARQRLVDGSRSRDDWERLHATALLVVVAIDQVASFERRVRRLTGDAELATARRRFDGACPDVDGLRDLIAHLDDYAVGSGERQTGRRDPPIDNKYLSTFLSWGNGEGTNIDLGGSRLNLRTAAAAAVELAEVTERVREQWEKRMHKEGQRELRARWERNVPGIELPPE